MFCPAWISTQSVSRAVMGGCGPHCDRRVTVIVIVIVIVIVRPILTTPPRMHLYSVWIGEFV